MEKRFKHSEILIDLTSLLDVIFIVLLIVMCHQTFLSEDSSAKLQEAEAEMARAEEMMEEAELTIELFSEHAEKYEEAGQYVLFIDVRAGVKSADNLKERTISVISGIQDAEETRADFFVSPSDEEEKYQELEETLEECISGFLEENSGLPVILTLNREDQDILYRDERAILEIFEKLETKHENLYCVGPL